MDLQETIVLRIKRERERWIHLATNYGPKGLQRTTHASSERHQWRWWTLSEMVSRLDLVVLDSAAAGWIFRRLPQCFWNIGVFIEQRGGPGGTRGGHNSSGRTWASWRALVGCASLGAPPRCSQGPLCSFWPIKILHKVSWHLDSVWYWFSMM